ncbi:MAG TPA: hypothetical protein VI757_16285, partial [Bacteroidia bacterium]|nr:hypothetical protein [Bacteroidia bacterium]
KDTRQIQDKKILYRIADCIDNVKNARALREISGIKKLQGIKNHYRIRIGEYRIGIVEEAGQVYASCIAKIFTDILQGEYSSIR